MNQNEAEVIEIEASKAKEAVAYRDALLRLSHNKDFDLIINKGYFTAEASRLCLLKSDFPMMEEKHQKMIDNQISGVGALYQYFLVINRQGHEADAALKDHAELESEDEG